MLKFVEELGMYVRPENINLLYVEGNNGAPTKGKKPTIKHWEINVEFVGGEVLVPETKYTSEEAGVTAMHQLAKVLNKKDNKKEIEGVDKEQFLENVHKYITREPETTIPAMAPTPADAEVEQPKDQVITIGEERSKFIRYLEVLGFKITLARINDSTAYTFIFTHPNKITGFNDQNFIAFEDTDPVEAVKAAITWFSLQPALINDETQDNYVEMKGFKKLIDAAVKAE